MSSQEPSAEPGPSTVDAPQTERNRIIGEKKDSCVPCFDALWFCYSPVHQMKIYYVYGTVDDCTGHWTKLIDCLKKKTTRYKDDVPVDPMAGKHPLWQLRTGLEAKEFWRKEFSHGEDIDGSSGTGAAEKDAGRPAMF